MRQYLVAQVRPAIRPDGRGDLPPADRVLERGEFVPVAIGAARSDVAQVLRAGGRASSLSGGGLLRSDVVVAEVALCFVLLVGSGLILRSFHALQQIDAGFDPHGLLLRHREMLERFA